MNNPTAPPKMILIAGPCVMESYELMYNTAKFLSDISKRYDLDFTFKCSFDKANRTSIDSYRGPGIKKGLNMMSELKKTLNLKTLTDVHETSECEPAAKVVDVLQIPAFLCRQTDLIYEASKVAKAINIKKGQFLSPQEIKHSIKKAYDAGNRNIMVTERGSCFGYNNLVVDFRSIPIMKEFGVPVIYDATHSLQMPGTNGNQTGGKREYIPTLAKAAIISGCDGIFMEVHEDPDKALSDSATQIPISYVTDLIEQMVKVYNLQKTLSEIKIPNYEISK